MHIDTPSCISSPDSEESSGLFQGTNSSITLVIGVIVGLIVTALLYTLILVSVVAWARRTKTTATAHLHAHSSVSNPVFGDNEETEEKEHIYD